MTKILVVDPLDLTLSDESGRYRWSSRACFDACLGDEQKVIFEYTTAKDPQICVRAKKSDGVILGGSEQSAWEDTTFNDHLLDLIAICRNTEIPFFGVCFGAQLLGRALGGIVARHPEGIELGSTLVRISEKGRQHFLFRGVNENCIQTVEAHSDAVLTLPPDCELLASTQHTPVQAFSFHGLLTGVQFHPEMNGEDLRCLWDAFLENGIVNDVPENQIQSIDECRSGRFPLVFKNFVAEVKARNLARFAV